MVYGLEVDMLNLGDADCIVVTQWTSTCACRVLIDGGSGCDFEVVRDFLLSRNYTDFYAVVCTHLHDDHAGGLIKLVQDKSFGIATGWMHDIRRHLSPDALRRAGSGSSGQAQNVRQVVENTKELADAFISRRIVPVEPFAGRTISYIPSLAVLSPDERFYKTTLEEFTRVDVPIPSPVSSAAASVLAGLTLVPPYGLPLPTPPEPLFPWPLPSTSPNTDLSALLAGVLGNSSVKEDPSTQPFNNTSAIVGGLLNGDRRLLFTGDAGSDALDQVSPDWKNLTWMQVPHHGSDGNLSQENIERFCPRFAYISAKGNTDHPSRAIVNGLIKIGAQVASTQKGNLWFGLGNATAPPGYGPLVLFKGTAARAIAVGGD